ncbi:hypothetical protein GCM10023324_40630 [Streptomyces youssoufiensis]
MADPAVTRPTLARTPPPSKIAHCPRPGRTRARSAPPPNSPDSRTFPGPRPRPPAPDTARQREVARKARR